jgi:hypothetical protein
VRGLEGNAPVEQHQGHNVHEVSLRAVIPVRPSALRRFIASAAQ